MTSRIRRLVIELLALVLGIELIVFAPDVALTTLVLAVPLVLVGATISVVYLRRVYLRQPVPRSRFFGMLVSVSARATLVGLWVGYLVVARIGERTGWFAIPVPPPAVSSPITGLVIAIWLSPPIVYALAVYRVRRSASRTLSLPVADALELDRETDVD